MAKQNIDYDIKLYSDKEFELDIRMDIDSKLFEKAVIASLAKFNVENKEVPDEITVDKRLLERAKVAYEKTIKVIEKELKSEGAIKKIIWFKVKEMKFLTNSKPVQVYTHIVGVYD